MASAGVTIPLNGNSGGFTQEEIAAVIGCDPKTLRIHYREELDNAFTHAKMMVTESIFLQATGGAEIGQRVNWEKARPEMTKFFAETRMGLRRASQVEVMGINGGPVQIETKDITARELISSELAGIAAKRATGSNPSETDGSAS